MCVVSFIPGGDKIFLTSNRDEHAFRGNAIFPTEISVASGSLVFPKDSRYGGSWICLSGNGNAGVLLNGAFEKHERKSSYGKSRGLIFLEIMGSEEPTDKFLRVSLSHIEPFTLIVWQLNQLFECRWDGVKKYIFEKDVHLPHLWLSATLYNAEGRQEKKRSFDTWTYDSNSLVADDIINFHKCLMRHEAEPRTVSISCMEIGKRTKHFAYLDLSADSYLTTSLNHFQS